MVTTEEKKKIGKASRKSGRRFEIEVRKDLEEQGFVVCKWTNTVDFENDKLVAAKSKYNPFLKRVISEGGGYPDYICMKRLTNEEIFDMLKEGKGEIKYPLKKRGDL